MQYLLTIGYENADIEDFLATLDQMQVDLVLDIRELPMSRRKGFAKTALTTNLARHGIAYRHEKRLGAPTPIRHQLRDDKDYAKYFKGFHAYMDTQTQWLETLPKTLPRTTVLLCYERDYTTCHRSVVADRLGKITGLTPRHIGVKKNAAKQVRNHPLLDSCQSLSAA